ncbi:MAG: hypothetical protein ACYTFY_19790, partial [Planctomycetota bacterium]
MNKKKTTKKTIVIIMAVLSIAIAGFLPVVFKKQEISKAQQEENILRQKMDSHPARAESFWQGWTDRLLEDRVAVAPDTLVDYITLDNKLYGYEQKPSNKGIDKSFLSDARQAMKGMPEKVKAQLDKHLIGVFIIKELGTTGYTEILRNFEKNKQGFIVLDVDALSRNANEWATWKENSPFKKEGRYKVNAVIENI